ncbi:MAG TPA: UTP--glucose-1-phosphate uridylyltransferase [Polyangia bacterium]|jgi:UTP--glucose-1-phosphate uridylyltransferase
MSNSPADELRRDLESLPAELRARLDASGFRDEWLLGLAAALWQPGTDARTRQRERNQVRGAVTPPRPDEVPPAPARAAPETARLTALGEAAIRRGELGFCVMAGGMATRMGGVVKALVEAFGGHTFLELRLGENETWGHRGGRPLPLWLMTSEATDGPIRAALAAAGVPAHVRTFGQGLGLRLTPDGRLFRGDDGQPSTYATGHGDVVEGLRRSGLLQAFRAAGGKYVWIANLDNLGATVDPALLGCFIENAGRGGAQVQVEVVDKAGDKGGIPVHALGHLQVLEEFRLPDGFDATTVPVFNTNTFLVDAAALETVRIDWNWFEVEKKVGSRVAIQYERLVQELTGVLPAAYVKVPREGAASRFLPVKDFDELARRRATIEQVARARGMLRG